MQTFLLYAPGSDVDVMLSYYAYLRDEASGEYLDANTDTFVSFESLVDGTWPLLENPDQPGEWLLEVVLPTFTGVLTFLPRNDADELLVDQVQKVYLVEGNKVPSTSAIAFLHESFDGFEAYRVLDGDGYPVEGADIFVYRKVDYDLRNLSNPTGRTVTDHRGYWVTPVPVDQGDTYTVLISAPGKSTTHVDVFVAAP